jgi:hypothetical protein
MRIEVTSDDESPKLQTYTLNEHITEIALERLYIIAKNSEQSEEVKQQLRNDYRLLRLAIWHRIPK